LRGSPFGWRREAFAITWRGVARDEGGRMAGARSETEGRKQGERALG
jgi:hypothetical protein